MPNLNPEEFLARLDQARANMNQAIENRKQLEISLEIYQNTLPAEVSRAESAVKVAAALLAEQESGKPVPGCRAGQIVFSGG